ncbi:MAG: T9SS type A sorting domain-containing protein [Bacteroidota bacterium]
MRRSLLFLFVVLAIAGRIVAQPGGGGQNNTCETANPFCTGTLYSFPAGVNAGAGQSGPCYSCLVTKPNPAWYFMKVATSGNIIIQMHSEPSKDIDFCCWGPFTSQYCCTQLTCNKVVSCSYSSASTETCNIPNGQTGEYYMLVITNFSNQPCNIIFSQTGGTGTTDCTILPPPCSNNSPLCVGQTIQLTANPIASATYRWSGPAGFHSTLQNPTIPNAQLNNAGDYYLRITVNGQPSADSSKTTVHIYQPVANAGNDTSISNGVFTRLHGNATQGSGSYKYHWEPANLLIQADTAAPKTVNLFTTTIFTLTVKDDSAGCQATDMVTVSIAGGALAVNGIALPSTICNGATTQLQAFGSGGTGNYTYQWTGPNNFNSNLQNPTVQPSVTSTYSVTISDGYNTQTSTVTVVVNPLPIANAGTGKSIPYGTYTFLNGSVQFPTSYYFYSWSPVDKLANASIQSPQTVNLTSTTIYSLIVTDLATNCVSDNQANVSIEVTGGPLNANPVATPDWICKDDTTQLHASAGGGNIGFYTYSWSSTPPGFASTVADPYVYPQQNTTYTVTLNDGFNTTQGMTSVSIYPQPYIHLGPADSLICIYDTIRLNAGNSGSTYLWSNGATTQTVKVQATGIVPETQTYLVKVTNEHGCFSTATINVSFSFNACTGISDINLDSRPFRIYPNPTKGKVTIEGTGAEKSISITITNAQGVIMKSLVLKGDGFGNTVETLDLSSFPKGIYFVRLGCDSQLWTEKLVIQ